MYFVSVTTIITLPATGTFDRKALGGSADYVASSQERPDDAEQIRFGRHGSGAGGRRLRTSSHVEAKSCWCLEKWPSCLRQYQAAAGLSGSDVTTLVDRRLKNSAA